MAEVNAQELEDARRDQVQGVIEHLESLKEMLEDMSVSEHKGFHLWNGGLPGNLGNLRSHSDFLAGQLASDFASLGVVRPNTQPQ